MKSDLVDVTLIRVTDTAKAVGFKETEEDEELVWLPRYAIEMEPTKKPGIFVVTMRESLAHEKGLI